MKIEMWLVDKIRPYPQNARKIPARAIEAVAKSIQEFGWRQPIVVDKTGTIVVGHARHGAALLLKQAKAPVHVASELTAQQIRLYRLADNRTNEETRWDNALLATELSQLQAMGCDLTQSAFDASDLERLLKPGAAEMERADEVVLPQDSKFVTKRGQVWRLGRHRAVCGDSTDPKVVETCIAGGSPALLLTDPPYGVSLDGEWRDRAGINKRGPAERNYLQQEKPPRTKGHGNTTMSSDTRADWSQVFELVPSLQVAYVWHASSFTREVLNGLERIGFLYPQQLIWDKGLAAMTRTHYWYEHEPCWYVRKKNAPWFGKPSKENSTIWRAASPKMLMAGSAEEKWDHPTQKPVELMRRPLLNHTRKGDLVWEPFLGSGTTLIAAEMTGRVCHGIELDPRFMDVVIRRWQKFSGQDAVLEVAGKPGATFNALAAKLAK